ncbi:hypothetical protein [Streptomyces pseudogriseolus]|uniref:hypothetical protein n=1 Tax=Streptomyces pseudogriseolus TaxID=36817 RepID=UPI00348094A5
MERSQNGRISKYCREACRQRRKRELASVAPGAVSQFLRYAHPRPGVHANAEAFYSAYVAWAGAYGIDPLAPSDMLPQLKAAGFQVVGTGAEQTVVMGDAENFDNSL